MSLSLRIDIMPPSGGIKLVGLISVRSIEGLHSTFFCLENKIHPFSIENMIVAVGETLFDSLLLSEYNESKASRLRRLGLDHNITVLYCAILREKILEVRYFKMNIRDARNWVPLVTSCASPPTKILRCFSSRIFFRALTLV
jgi:hypothetical protein